MGSQRYKHGYSSSHPQLARQNAQALEAFNDGRLMYFFVKNPQEQTRTSDLPENAAPPEAIDAGVEIMESFFEKWSAPVNSQLEDEDVDMGDIEQELRDVKKHIDSLRPDIEKNVWLSSIIRSF